MGTDADPIPQKTNPYSSAEETDANATPFSIAPAITNSNANRAFSMASANTDSEPYSAEANADPIPEKAYGDADSIIATELAKSEESRDRVVSKRNRNAETGSSLNSEAWLRVIRYPLLVNRKSRMGSYRSKRGAESLDQRGKG